MNTPPPIPDLGVPSWAGTLCVVLVVIGVIPAAVLGAAALWDRLVRRRRRHR